MTMIKDKTMSCADLLTTGKTASRKPSIKDFSDEPPHVYTKREKALIKTGQAVIRLFTQRNHEQIPNPTV